MHGLLQNYLPCCVAVAVKRLASAAALAGTGPDYRQTLGSGAT